MCITCEHMLYEEHRERETEPLDPCPKCKKFRSNDGKACYHCFCIGNEMEECPECEGKPWSKEFLEVKAEFEKENPDSIH